MVKTLVKKLCNKILTNTNGLKVHLRSCISKNIDKLHSIVDSNTSHVDESE